MDKENLDTCSTNNTDEEQLLTRRQFLRFIPLLVLGTYSMANNLIHNPSIVSRALRRVFESEGYNGLVTPPNPEINTLEKLEDFKTSAELLACYSETEQMMETYIDELSELKRLTRQVQYYNSGRIANKPTQGYAEIGLTEFESSSFQESEDINIFVFYGGHGSNTDEQLYRYTPFFKYLDSLVVNGIIKPFKFIIVDAAHRDNTSAATDNSEIVNGSIHYGANVFSGLNKNLISPFLIQRVLELHRKGIQVNVMGGGFSAGGTMISELVNHYNLRMPKNPFTALFRYASASRPFLVNNGAVLEESLDSDSIPEINHTINKFYNVIKKPLVLNEYVGAFENVWSVIASTLLSDNIYRVPTHIERKAKTISGYIQDSDGKTKAIGHDFLPLLLHSAKDIVHQMRVA